MPINYIQGETEDMTCKDRLKNDIVVGMRLYLDPNHSGSGNSTGNKKSGYHGTGNTASYSKQYK